MSNMVSKILVLLANAKLQELALYSRPVFEVRK